MAFGNYFVTMVIEKSAEAFGALACEVGIESQLLKDRTERILSGQVLEADPGFVCLSLSGLAARGGRIGDMGNCFPAILIVFAGSRASWIQTLVALTLLHSC